ncbi:HAMP domain-containing histidine kinase [Paenibacillus doosanensis]|uniref:histidine kinase n=1 Tax=Paenibacillus konkukensis TaxID=2020716 RepID=A0ABY4RN49_9BACL|nr:MULTISPECIES: HAMP domain-containing sensor histidine kinase [Paenibacillus]MCS7461758.1 HAMP domain-containing histidine kinase [Paenibacillus doosanensis]UQZ83598.1 Signal transduction histidine-protein kinase BaeS [Paenibacillus konkukensis]
MPKIKYRFTFFQRLALSHLIVSLLILALLSMGFAYYVKQQVYDSVTQELNNSAKVVSKLLSKDEENSGPQVQNYRNLLNERKISFILFNKTGEVLFSDPNMPAALLGKPFLDSLRARISSIQNNESFIVSRNIPEPLVVLGKTIKPRSEKGDMHLFIFSPLEGYKETLQTFYDALLFMIAIVFLLAVFVSLLISRNISKSIQPLRQATRQIAAGDYAARLPVNRTDELGDLAADFNSMAAQLEASSNMLGQYENRRRQFIMDVTHELRTPLTSIRGIIEGLKNDLVAEQEERYRYYGIIEKETFRLIRLINELLDMEKIESGMISLAKKHTPLRELMEIVAESLEVLVEEKNLQIIIECEPGLQVYGDYDRLTQILLNLVKNSIQFTQYGSIRLKGSETNTETRIEISDTGRGMSSEELSLIWERFYKADPSRTKSNSETGLGLSIVKQLVEAHQGTIEVQSAPGLGSVFIVSMPKEERQSALPQSERGLSSS